MRRTKVCVFTLSVIFMFILFGTLGAQEKKLKLIPRPAATDSPQKISLAASQEKRTRYLDQRKRTRSRVARLAPGLSRGNSSETNDVEIILGTDFVNWVQDPWLGYVYMTGLCLNEGYTKAIATYVEVTFYDIDQNYLGYDWNYVYGGGNVRLQVEGFDMCPNALSYYETGFFAVWPEVAYSDAYYYSVEFFYYTGASDLPNVQPQFYGDVYAGEYQGVLELYGNVRNPSATYVTYLTEAWFAVFNADNTKVLDVWGGTVGGSEYDGYLGAIYPLQTESFDFVFDFAPYSQVSGNGISALLWCEAFDGQRDDIEMPFGSFDTPVNNANVCSSIAVTGWALDDTGIKHVKLYREQGSQLVYIGDANLVEGARPDVAAQYPQYPYNTSAGWGYMLLTNFLPNSGNGTFTLHAIATDNAGKSATLGIKTIQCDNGNAIKPFGAIDTPGQGGVASGNKFVNWGWVLTPLPNEIPTDGSSIKVWVDGVQAGSPVYNIYRSDIATLFPGYANSNGAVGYFYLDTTAFANGVHTIQWTARDSGGNSDGIGSRYFTIDNSSGRAMNRALFIGPQKPPLNARELFMLPEDPLSPLTKHQTKIEPANTQIVSRELERIEIKLNGPGSAGQGYSYSGYMVNGERLSELPIGSTLDSQKGIFYWQPGPGFLGRYHLVFVAFSPEGEAMKHTVTVEIIPKH